MKKLRLSDYAVEAMAKARREREAITTLQSVSMTRLHRKSGQSVMNRTTAL